ncbi:MAG: mechanosensitive ion channel domain-containing protein, partial [Arenicellales bacterium]
MKQIINNIQNSLQELLQQKLGLAENIAELCQLLISFLALLVFAYAVNWIVIHIIRWFITIIMPRVSKKSSAKWMVALGDQKVARRSAHVLTILIIYWMLPFVIEGYPHVLDVIQTLIKAYMIILTVSVINATFHAGGEVYQDIEKRTGMPLHFVTQAAQVVTWVVASIILVSVLFDTSIPVLLGGLAGISAVLMLVFRDSIVGFVSGMMLIGNDMLRVGDWIEAPQYNADGTVTDIGLTTVKVQNFDKTISTIPSYSLFSESFRNWRGMYN